jgi:hypothetical protein
MQGNREATNAVVEHVLIPLFGRKEEKPMREPREEPVEPVQPAEKEVF